MKIQMIQPKSKEFNENPHHLTKIQIIKRKSKEFDENINNSLKTQIIQGKSKPSSLYQNPWLKRFSLKTKRFILN